MGALWVVFAATLCVLGSASGAPCEPCDGEPVFEVEPCVPPATPCVSQMVEMVPIGSFLPPVDEACEEVLSPVILPSVGPPVLAPHPPQILLPPYTPPAMVAHYPPPPVASLYIPPSPLLPSAAAAVNRPCPLVANPPFPPPTANPPCPPPAAHPPCSPPAANPPCPPSEVNPPCDDSPPCDAEGIPLPLPPTALSFALPVPPQPTSAPVFSLLSQTQNGDPNLLLSQLTQYLASTLPTSQLQAAAGTLPPPQEPCDVPVEPPPCASPAPVQIQNTPSSPYANPGPFLPYTGIQTPVNYHPPPPPTYFVPPQKHEPEPYYNQPPDHATLAALQKQTSRGLISLPPDTLAHIYQADVPEGGNGLLPTVETAPAPFEMSKFGQASNQLLNPWPRVYDPLRRLYKPSGH